MDNEINDFINNAVENQSEGILLMIETSDRMKNNVVKDILLSFISNDFSGVFIAFESHDYESREIAAPVPSKTIELTPETNMDVIIKSIYESIEELDGGKKFIFIDSINKISEYNPLSEVKRLFEFLSGEVRKEKNKELVIVFTVDKNISTNEFITQSAKKADKVIK